MLSSSVCICGNICDTHTVREQLSADDTRLNCRHARASTNSSSPVWFCLVLRRNIFEGFGVIPPSSSILLSTSPWSSTSPSSSLLLTLPGTTEEVNFENNSVWGWPDLGVLDQCGSDTLQDRNNTSFVVLELFDWSRQVMYGLTTNHTESASKLTFSSKINQCFLAI